MYVRWKNIISYNFSVSNVVHQGGIFSSNLFGVYMYMDDLSNKLNKLNARYIIGFMLINHLMYTDDLVLIWLLYLWVYQCYNLCSEFGLEHDIKYNSAKSNVMIFWHIITDLSDNHHMSRLMP